MENKLKIGLLGVFLLATLIVLSTSFVLGAVTLRIPADNAVIGASATSVLNTNVTESTVGFTAKFNCSWYAKSTSLTANQTWALLLYQINSTTAGIGKNYTNGTFATIVLEDGNDYTFNTTCYNESHWIGEDTSTSITIDNGIPQATSAPYPSDDSKYPNSSLEISVTVTSRNTTSCNLYFPNSVPENPSYTMTHSSSADTCTQSISNVAEGIYDWYVITSDASNTTTGSIYTFKIDTTEGGAKGAAVLAIKEGLVVEKDGMLVVATKPLAFTDAEGKLKTGWIIVIVVIAIFIIIAIKKRIK